MPCNHRQLVLASFRFGIGNLLNTSLRAVMVGVGGVDTVTCMVWFFSRFHWLGIPASTRHTPPKACHCPSSSTSGTASTTVPRAPLLLLPGTVAASIAIARVPLLHLDHRRRLYRHGSDHHDPLTVVALVYGQAIPTMAARGNDERSTDGRHKIDGVRGRSP